IVTPLGPARAVALKLTFVKPPAGARTTTCVSTVSPRAPNRLMEDAEPGASVAATLSRPGAVQTTSVPGFVALTVSVAALLAAFPAGVLNTTGKWGPLSAPVGAGGEELEGVGPPRPVPFFF